MAKPKCGNCGSSDVAVGGWSVSCNVCGAATRFADGDDNLAESAPHSPVPSPPETKSVLADDSSVYDWSAEYAR